MRKLVAAAAALAFLLAAAPARAGDPIMPLAEVRAGMQCTGYSVVRGTDISAFAVQVLDVVDGGATGGGARILIEVSGPAVDATGIGPGFSGSPIFCPDAQGTARNIGAISESVGEYGGKVVLATPIEAILGNPVDAPRATPARALGAAARPLAAPLTVSGLAPRVGAALQRAAARKGRAVLAVPAGPLGSFPVQTLRPGSAFGVGYATGDLALGAVGTVAYVDGDRVWGFGHQLDAVGARALALQDAYVFRVINSPLVLPPASGTYKLAAPGHTLGTLSNDALDAVAGRAGAPPPTVPVRVHATDLDTGARRTFASSVADETEVGQPLGSSIVSLVAPLAMIQATGGVLGGSPARLTGRACFRIFVREAKQPFRFCNRYVTDSADESGAGSVLAAAAADDIAQALSTIDAYTAGPAHVAGVESRLQVRRGQRQAFLNAVRLPRRARAGQRVRATLVLRLVRGGVLRRRVRLRLPDDLSPGRRRVAFLGSDVDGGPDDEIFTALIEILLDGAPGGDAGPPSLRALRAAVEATARFDGLEAGEPGDDVDELQPAYLDPDLRISGQAVGVDPHQALGARRERGPDLGGEERVGQVRGHVLGRPQQPLDAQDADLGAELVRGGQDPAEAVGARRGAGREGEQLRPRGREARHVPVAVERRAHDGVAAGAEVGEHGGGVRRAEARAVAPGDQQRAAARVRDRGGEPLAPVAAGRREDRDAAADQRRDLVHRIGRARPPARRRRVRRPAPTPPPGARARPAARRSPPARAVARARA